MFIKGRGDVSANVFAAEGMSTRIGMSERIVGHLFHTNAALEQLLGGLGKLGALCREYAVLLVKSFCSRIASRILSTRSEGGVGGLAR